MGKANGHSKLEELGTVITEFQDQLFRFAFFRTGSFADSQDIVQEVFIKFYQENSHLSSVKNIKFYLFKSISNACVDYHRKTRKLKFEVLDKLIQTSDLQEADALQNLIHREEYNRIEELLNELPNEQSEAISLRVLDNLSFAEIAAILDVPVTTVKSRFKYGIDKLKTKIVNSKEVSYGL